MDKLIYNEIQLLKTALREWDAKQRARHGYCATGGAQRAQRRELLGLELRTELSLKLFCGWVNTEG